MKHLLMNHFIILGLALSLSACNGVGTAKFDKAAVGTGGTIGDGTGQAVNFSGITSISNATDSAITVNWIAHADAVAYDIYNTQSGSLVFLSTITGQASNQVNLTGLTPGAAYKFRVRMRTSSGVTDTNTNDVAVTMNAAPNTPTVALLAPGTSPSFIATPTIRVSGVKSGDTVKLYSDSCSTEVASGVASGSTIDLTSSTLPAASYNMAATSTNSVANASACSGTVAYVKNLCPSDKGDYIPVPANADLGTSEFCVAKYEMKSNTGAKSEAAGNPWVSISQTDSKTACTAVGPRYALISNAEWMAIALNIEQVNSNWSGGSAGTGTLNRGWAASSTLGDTWTHTAVAPSTAAGCLYSSAANTCAATGLHKFKRTHTLNNGEEIWDFAGNVWDWVDWNVTPAQKAYQASDPITSDKGWKDWYLIDSKIGAADEMKPSTWESVFSLTLGGNEGLGRYYAGVNNSGDAARRSGQWDDGTDAGAFTLALNQAAGNTGTYLGFRCVYRP